MPLRFDTMEARHLVFVYVGVWLVQGGYLGWIAWQWLRMRRPGASADEM